MIERFMDFSLYAIYNYIIILMFYNHFAIEVFRRM